jgi:hypothetical protein
MTASDTPPMSPCIGFGEFEGTCENEAGDSPWSKLWCLRCDRLRLDHITAQMEKISARFAVEAPPHPEERTPTSEPAGHVPSKPAPNQINRSA